MPLPKLKEIEGSAELEQMIEKAREASDMLKALSHESRCCCFASSLRARSP